MLNQRDGKVEVHAWARLFGNVSLALLKGTVGWFAASKALLADALHSLSDSAASAAVLFGIHGAKQRGGSRSLLQREKSETIAKIVMAALLIVIAVEMAISSWGAIQSGLAGPPKSYAIIAIAAAFLLKEWLLRSISAESSGAVKTGFGIDPERRSDMYASVAALTGACGAVIGDLIHVGALYVMDPLAGIFISLLVFRKGYRLVAGAVRNTTDRMLDQEDADELIRAVQCVKGVIAVDDLQAREQGHYVIVEVKISVNPGITVAEGNDIAKLVKNHLMKRFIHLSDVLVQVNPYDPGYPYKHNRDLDQDDFPTVLH